MRQVTEASQKECLNRLFFRILGDQKAAAWLAEQRMDKVEELRTRFSEKKVALVSFDVDCIKDFVFETTKPLEIQGASKMVEGMDAEGYIMKDLLSSKELDLTFDNILFAGGGTGLMIVPAAQASALSDKIKTQFADKTGTGSCTVTYTVFAPHELVQGPDITSTDKDIFPGVDLIAAKDSLPISFGEIMRLLADKLREAKEEKITFHHSPLPGFIRRCESCGIEAAIKGDPIRPKDSKNRICSYCLEKRNKGRNKRDKLERTLRSTALTINDIADQDKHGYYAVVYADANNMGSILFEMKTMADYALFSWAVTDVLRTTTDDLIIEQKLNGCYQAPVIGGDDILFIVPAQKAARLTQGLMEKVREGFKKKIDETEMTGNLAESLRGIGMSVGFVIVPAHFAIRYAVDYAEAVLHSAKKGRNDKGEDCIDYLVVKDASPLNLAIDELRKAEFRREGRAWQVDLTCKPVTVSEFNGMLSCAEALHESGMPQSQLHQIKTFLQQESPKVTSMLTRCQIVRVKAWHKFRDLIGRNGSEDAEQKDLTQQDVEQIVSEMRILCKLDKESEKYESGFLDLMEIYEFQEE